MNEGGGFPKLGLPSWGVPIMSIVISGGLLWGLPILILGNYPGISRERGSIRVEAPIGLDACSILRNQVAT